MKGLQKENAFITAIREALADDAVAENNSEEKVIVMILIKADVVTNLMKMGVLMESAEYRLL